MMIERNPAPDTDGQIETCCVISGREGAKRAFYEVLPDSGAHLIFRFSPEGCRLVLMGQATEKTSVEIDGASNYLYIRFHAGSVPRLADIHPAELIDAHADLSSIRGIPIDSLADQLLSLSGQEERLKLVKALISGRPPLIRDPRCRRAISIAEAHAGQIPVSDLAAGMGISVRSLERIFMGGLGMGPKRFSCLVRLRRVSSLLRSGGFGSLTDLTFLCGYSDQSHMIRDFKSMTGRLPGELRAWDMRRVETTPETRVIHRYRP